MALLLSLRPALIDTVDCRPLTTLTFAAEGHLLAHSQRVAVRYAIKYEKVGGDVVWDTSDTPPFHAAECGNAAVVALLAHKPSLIDAEHQTAFLRQ